jgi:hypothetical protein
MRTARLSALLLLAVPLVGCQTNQERMAEFKARNEALDDQTCRGYGAKPGTDIYIQCRMQRQQSRDAADNAAGAAVAAPVRMNPVPASDAPAIGLWSFRKPDANRCGLERQCRRFAIRRSVGRIEAEGVIRRRAAANYPVIRPDAATTS